MKKIFIVLLASLFLFTLTGCKNKEENVVNEAKDLIKEKLKKAKAEVDAASGYQNEDGDPVVYWASNGKKYHSDPDCPAFSYSETVYEGTIEDAFERGLDPCRRCIPELDEE